MNGVHPIDYRPPVSAEAAFWNDQIPKCSVTGRMKPECCCPTCMRELIHNHGGGS